jgi:type I restriction enzyme S subunit
MSAKAHWTRVTFGDVVRQVKDRVDPEGSGLERYVAGEHMDTDDLRIRRWGTIGDGYLGPAFHMRFKPGQVLYGSRRTYLRKVAVADFEGITANTTFVLESKDPRVLLPELLPFVMQTEVFHEHAITQSKGSVNPYINFSDLTWFEFPLPPFDEQRRIAAALEAARAVNEAMRRVRDAGERSRKAFIVALFQSGLRQERRRSTPIGPVPKSWDVVPLGDRYQVQLGKMISDAARQGGGQVPYIRNANVQWNRLELDDVATMAMSAREREKFSLRPGDILACEGRHVGKSALWRGEIPGATYQKALHRLRRLSDRDFPEYMLHCLQYYSWMGRFVVETGETTIPHLPAERFRAMLFPFPTRTEQEEIATAILNYDASMFAIDERLTRTRGLLGQMIRPWDTQ